MKAEDKYFKLLPHGPLKEVLPNIFTVTGTMKIFGVFQYSRTMTILKDGGRLGIVNPVRLNTQQLAQLEQLGKVECIFKIGQLHNVDIPFYMDYFSPQLWVTRGDSSEESYQVTEFFDDHEVIPILQARIHVIQVSKSPETLLVTPQDGGSLHSCDAFVNMGADPMANWVTKQFSKLLPSPTYIGPNWIKIAKPPKDSMLKVLNYEFENFIPAHGEPIIGKAKEKIEKYLNRYYSINTSPV